MARMNCQYFAVATNRTYIQNKKGGTHHYSTIVNKMSMDVQIAWMASQPHPLQICMAANQFFRLNSSQHNRLHTGILKMLLSKILCWGTLLSWLIMLRITQRSFWPKWQMWYFFFPPPPHAHHPLIPAFLSVIILYVIMLSVVAPILTSKRGNSIKAQLIRLPVQTWQYEKITNPWTNFSCQDKPCAELSTLEVAACLPCTYCLVLKYDLNYSWKLGPNNF